MPAEKTPIVLIHGLWMPPHSWNPWIDRYTAAGYTVHAPAWPGVSERTEELDHTKADPIGVGDVVKHFKTYVEGLPERPILMGHSFGGLITQMLLSDGLGRAGVAIHPAAPRGVYRLPLSVLRATFPVLRNPSNRNRTVPLTPSSTTRSPIRFRGRNPTPGMPNWRSPRRAGRCSSPRWPTSAPRSKRRRSSTTTIPTGRRSY
jgi:pimeloyl-ACP methyl ester carboxylesterase